MIYDKVPISAAEVPMPQGYAERPSDYIGSIWIESQMRQYGDLREAAGYARGLAESEETRRLYNELLYQVETKNPGETRHETALVYIRMAEKYLRNQNAQEVKCGACDGAGRMVWDASPLECSVMRKE